MLNRFIAAICIACTLTACSSKSDTSNTSNTSGTTSTTSTTNTTSTTSTTTAQHAGDFTVATQFSPDPPKQGPETITVTVKDAGGNPVKSATVKIVTDMPSMTMSGPTLRASSNGDGTYSAQTNLNYATQWTFDVQIKSGAKTGHAVVKADVK
ncbi:MAG: YtkA-like [Candidatus Eremiobacteraeota bacterium]|nr:YtkA-like [Candidatus Eremiobacteraeota bacterium]